MANKGNVYLIRLYNKDESFFKIGSTVHRYCRFYEIMKSGYSVDIVFMGHGYDFLKAMYAEAYLQTLFETYCPKIKFGGYTECFVSVDVKTFADELFGFAGEATEYTKDLPINWR